MLQLHNSTPFVADIAIFPNEQGVDTLYLIAKATFDVGEKVTLAEPQEPLASKDEYRGDPQHSSLLSASDYHLAKPGTDVVVIGDCYAPGSGAVQCCDVDVQVGPLTKSLRIFGDRVWDGGAITSPRTFERMPLIYENAFGGTVYADGSVHAAQASNPVGLGFAAGRSVEQMQGERLPNIEDPAHLIQAVSDEPGPAGVGAIAPFWPGRSQYAGSYDEQWQRERAPFLPRDFDRRFFQVASPGLTSQGYLRGGEPVVITNMSESGYWAFDLPAASLVGHIDWRARLHEVKLRLETVVLAPNLNRVSMTWRGALTVNQHALKVEQVTLKMQRAQVS